MPENENQPPIPSKLTSSVPLRNETIRVTLKASNAPPAVPAASGMPENEAQPAPSKQTSSVPLKKETVRVTLKAADAPPLVPSATVPMISPVRPPVPTSRPSPTAPAPTIPLRTAGKPTASPAPTIRLAGATAAPTVGAPKAIGGLPTLPKATVQLQAPTQPLGTSFPTSSKAATFKIEEEEEEEEVEAHAGLIKIISGLGLAAAITLLVFQLLISKIWIEAVDNPKKESDGWMQLFQ